MEWRECCRNEAALPEYGGGESSPPPQRQDRLDFLASLTDQRFLKNTEHADGGAGKTAAAFHAEKFPHSLDEFNLRLPPLTNTDARLQRMRRQRGC
jgi:hypothetical protein